MINSPVNIADGSNFDLVINDNSLLLSLTQSNQNWNSAKSYSFFFFIKNFSSLYLTCERSISISNAQSTDISNHTASEHSLLQFKSRDANSEIDTDHLDKFQHKSNQAKKIIIFEIFIHFYKEGRSLKV